MLLVGTICVLNCSPHCLGDPVRTMGCLEQGEDRSQRYAGQRGFDNIERVLKGGRWLPIPPHVCGEVCTEITFTACHNGIWFGVWKAPADTVLNSGT
jgi:hypothetical protein